MELQNKNVVVTGGSQGIGAEIAAAFSEAGATVLIIARSEEKLAAVASRIGAQYFTADLTDQSDLDTLVARSIDVLGHVDVWVNNAGVETRDGFVDTPREDIRQLCRLNFEAPLLLTHDVANHMVARGGGHIVQMSSVAGVIPFPGLSAYAGTKAGLTNFTESLRMELARTPINLTVVAPGPVDTEMWDRLDTADAYQAAALKRFRQLQFLPKVDPKKLAAATVEAVAKDKRFLRVPARYGMYHMLNNAPRRMVELAMTGVKLPPPGSTS